MGEGREGKGREAREERTAPLINLQQVLVISPCRIIYMKREFKGIISSPSTSCFKLHSFNDQPIN